MIRQSNTMGITTYLSIIVLNTNGVNVPIKNKQANK